MVDTGLTFFFLRSYSSAIKTKLFIPWQNCSLVTDEHLSNVVYSSFFSETMLLTWAANPNE